MSVALGLVRLVGGVAIWAFGERWVTLGREDGKSSGMMTGTILIVDQDDRLRRVIAGPLEAEGYTVLQSAGARDALELAQKRRDLLSLLITNTALADMDGLALAGRLTRIRPETRVLFASVRPDRDTPNSPAERSGHPFLYVPFTRQELLEKVRSALAVGRSPADAFAQLLLRPASAAAAVPQACPAGSEPRATRYRVVLPLRCRVPGDPEWHSGVTENMSQTGILLHSEQLSQCASECAPETMLEILIEVPNDLDTNRESHITCEGRIMRTVGGEGSTIAPAIAVAVGAYNLVN